MEPTFAWLKLRRKLFQRLVLSLRHSNDLEAAKEALLRWIAEVPDKEALMQMAELEAQDANYKAATEWLRKAVDEHPDVDKDWKLTTMLALGEISDSSEALKRELNSSPELQNGISALLEKFWERSARLGSAAHEHLVYAVQLQHFCSLGPARIRVLNAAAYCAKALELEFREKIFVPFRDLVSQDSNLQILAEQALQSEPSKAFGQFLIRDRGLGLGHMAGVLRGRHAGITSAFRAWLEREHPTTASIEIEHLNQITMVRNNEAHVLQRPCDPERVIELCRKMIDLIA